MLTGAVGPASVLGQDPTADEPPPEPDDESTRGAASGPASRDETAGDVPPHEAMDAGTRSVAPAPGPRGSAERLADLSLEELLNFEIRSASTIPQTVREAPSIVSVVTPTQLHDYGWITLNDVLYRQAGFSPSRDYDRRTVSSRGLFEGWNNNHLLLLVDGVQWNDHYGSAHTWEIMPLFLVRSLEIIRGPGSALYGSNATNGVVAINTPSARELHGQSLARLRFGTQRHIIGDAVTGVAGSRAGLVLGAQTFRTTGFEHASTDASGRLDPSGRLARFRIRDDRESHYLFAKVEAYGALEGLQLQAHYQRWDYQTGHGWLFAIPDFRENMSEGRLMTVLSYRNEGPRVSQYYALRHQRHDRDWTNRYFPTGSSAFGIDFPDGVWESLDNTTSDLLAKAELTFWLPREASLLVGATSTTFYYRGDREHWSNIDLDSSFEPFPNGEIRNVGSYLGWLRGNPMWSLGVYSQLASGHLLGDHVTATVGVRYDLSTFEYNQLDVPGAPDARRTFQQVSPRLGLVFEVTDELSIKALAARAFRAPAATELGGSSTLALASNVRALDPESVLTGELAVEWQALSGLSVRATGFFTRFDDQIAYSTQGANLSTNLYSLSTAGAEAELYYEAGPLTGFANYAYAERIAEDVRDPGISPSGNRLTWVPRHVANVGAHVRHGDFDASMQLHVQGRVYRRASDRVDPTNLAERGRYVPGFMGLDARIGYRPLPEVELELMINNALDGLFRGSANRLVKNFDYPFDYRADGRRILASVTLRL